MEFFDLSETATWLALTLALLGAFGSFWYTGYLGTGAGIGTKIFSAIVTAILGYIVAIWIFNR